MKYSEFKKKQRLHTRCVVCGKSFGAYYEEELKAFPIYHLKKESSEKFKCEDRFYEALLRIYVFMHKQEQSITMNELIQRFDWLGLVLMKKDMLAWCLGRGYLTLDNMNRIEIPPPVEDICHKMFNSVNLNDPSSAYVAVEMIKGVFQNMKQHLKSVPPDQMPFKKGELNLGETTLYQNIDTSKVELKRDRKGMITAARTGAREIDQRMSAPSSSLERRRNEKVEK